MARAKDKSALTPDRRRAGWMLAALLALAFLLGGGSRADIVSLVVLRPLSAIALAVALGFALKRQLGGFAFPIGILAGWLTLIAVQLVPLPPSLWTALPGREVIAANYAVLGIDPGWKPLTIGPMATINSLQALFLPLAALIFYSAADDAGRRRALAVAVGLTIFSALLGIGQLIGARDWLYPFRVTNPGFPVGLFANRNHQAAVIAAMVPMLLALTHRSGSGSGDAVSRWGGRLTALVLTAMAVMTGSRAGTVLALGALFAAAMLFATQSEGRGDSALDRLPAFARRLVIPALLLLTVAAMFYFATGTAFERFGEKDSLEDIRFQILPTMWRMTVETFPVGFGFGTFAEAYKIYELPGLMIPAYVNRAHNDWIEIVLEGGLAAVLLAGAMVVWAVRRCWTLRTVILNPRDRLDRLRAAAAIGLVVLLAASLFDYPLRTPAAACLMANLLGCLATSRRSA